MDMDVVKQVFEKEKPYIIIKIKMKLKMVFACFLM